ncbi:MAG: hypothetical protein KDE27_22045 [Planctomycetes bacterium]|nr:hypothetical protein [Planctomycetota bacterium]
MTDGRALRRGNWSVQELERLRDLLPRRGVRGAATLLRRSPASVYRKALEIMRSPPRRGAWSRRDDRLLRDAWGVLDQRLLAAILGRSVAQVGARAEAIRGELGSGPWSQRERNRLKQFFGTRSDVDLEVCLQRPRDQIAAMARELCLAKDKRFSAAARRRAGADRGAAMPRWSSAEVATLRTLYVRHDNLEIARRLGRTVASVANKASQLGLRKGADVLASIGRANVRARYENDPAAPEAGSVDASSP